jgi:aminoglycoside phosphotransferase (APT) family kinase protein
VLRGVGDRARDQRLPGTGRTGDDQERAHPSSLADSTFACRRGRRSGADAGAGSTVGGVSVAGFSVGDVELLARRVLAVDGLRVERHPVGFGNENWRIETAAGARYVLKAAGRDNEAKWNSSHVAYGLARSAGLPVAELVFTGAVEDRLVRILTWIEGRPASRLEVGSAQGTQMLRSLGDAARVMHTIRRDRFSSRLDGSAPSFVSWKAYLDHRLGQIRRRCRTAQAVDEDLVDRVCSVAGGLVDEVDDVAEAVLCHRDLHPDNLIVDADGTLVGIIDWDGAEAWDRAGDWFKLEFELLRAHPAGEGLLLAAYLDGAPTPPRWAERRRLVHLIEALNILPNAATQAWNRDYARRARAHLDELLAHDQ